MKRDLRPVEALLACLATDTPFKIVPKRLELNTQEILVMVPQEQKRCTYVDHRGVGKPADYCSLCYKY